MNQQLIQVAVTMVPSIIDWLREAFRKENPTLPQPTDAEIIAAYNVAFVSSLAKDDTWLQAHPREGEKPVTGSA
jgi:hypothetical protein